jgi:RNA polymerase sigma-70 factor (ECF subfamily)
MMDAMNRLLHDDWEAFRQKADEHSFRAIYDKTSALVFTICLRKLKNEEDALDAFQATYTRLLAITQNPAAEAGSQSPPDPDLDINREIRRLALSEADRLRLRRSRRSKREVIVETIPESVQKGLSPRELAADREYRAKIEALISMLPEKYHLPLLWHFFDGMTHDEIAQTLDVPRSTVTHQIRRGLKRLQPLLRRAGLAETTAMFAALAVGGALIRPPAVASAQAIYQQAMSLIAAGQVSGASFVGATLRAGASAGKIALIAGVAAVVLIGVVFLSPRTSSIPADRTQRQAPSASTSATAPAGPEQPATSPPTQDRANEAAAVDSNAQAMEPGASVAHMDAPTSIPSPRTLSFRAVWHENQKPAPDTRIIIEQSGAAQQSPPPAATDSQPQPAEKPHATSDPTGLASVTIPGDWQKVRIEALHKDSTRLTLDINTADVAVSSQSAASSQPTESSPSGPVLLKLEKGVSVFGRLWYEETGQPAEGKKISLHKYNCCSCGGDPLVTSTPAAADGSYRFDNIAADELLLRADQEEWVSRVDDGVPETFKTLPGQVLGPYDLFLQQGGTLRGQIRDRKTGKPIEGATIHFYHRVQREVLSDPKGAYEIVGMPERSLDLYVKATGYASENTLISPKLGEATTLDFDLEPGTPVEVVVKDSDGKPIAGARIYRVTASMWRGDSSDLTDENGRFLMKDFSRTREMKIAAQCAGYRDSEKRMPEFPVGNAPGKVDLMLQPIPEGTSLFTGRVTGPNDEPLAGVAIVYGSPSGGGNPSTQTNSEGEYQLEVKVVRDWDMLFAHGDGWAPKWIRSAKPGPVEKPAIYNFKLETEHWLRGKVVDEQGEPVRGVFIQFYPSGESTGERIPGLPFSLRTDEQGAFYQNKLPPPPISLEVYGTGWTRHEARSFPLDKEMQIVLRKAGVLRGRVVHKESGEAVESFLVKVRGNHITSTRVNPGQRFNSPDGRFALDDLNVEAPYGVTIEAGDYPALTLENLLAAKEESKEEILFEMAAGTTLQGIVVDAQTHQPIAGASIFYCRVKDDFPLSWGRLDENSWSLNNKQRAVTPADGTFSFTEAQQPGTLFVRARGHCRLRLEPGERMMEPDTGRLLVALDHQSVLRGRLLMNGMPRAGEAIHLSFNKRSHSNKTRRWEMDLEDCRTDAQGFFHWEELTAGTYILAYWKSLGGFSFPTMSKTITLGAEEEKSVDLGDNRGPLTLRGRVLKEGQPIEQTRIQLTPRFPSEYDFFTEYSDANGAYEMTGLKPGAYSVRVSHYGDGPGDRLNKEFILELTGNLERDIVFAEKNMLTGRVVLEDGAKGNVTTIQIENPALLNALGSVGLTSEGDVEVTQYAKVSEGRFEMAGRFKGDYTLRVTLEKDGRSAIIALPEPLVLDTLGGNQDLGDIRIPASGAVRVHARFLEPRPDEKATLIMSLRTEGETLPRAHFSPKVTEAPQLFENIPAGEFILAFGGLGFKADSIEPKTLRIEPGVVADVHVTIRPVGMIIGMCGGSGSQPAKLQRVRLTGPGTERELTPCANMEEYQQAALNGSDVAWSLLFMFSNLGEGDYQVHIEAEGFAPHVETIHVTPGTSVPQQINLTPQTPEDE